MCCDKVFAPLTPQVRLVYTKCKRCFTVKVIRWLTVLLLAGAMAACASSTQNIKERADWMPGARSEDSSLVFGRVQWLENGEEKKIGKGVFDFSLKPGLLRLEDKSRTFCELGENGEFIWELKPGTYVVYRLNYWDTWSGNYYIVPKVAFHVSGKGKSIYIGTLKGDFAPKRDLIGGLSGKVKVTILDHSDMSYPAIAKLLSISPNKIEKSLMVHDEKIPRTIDTTAEFNLAISILNAILFGVSQ